MIKVIDLFCGIGGLTNGLESAGLNVVAGIDFDKSCKFAYEENNNAKFIYQNISEVTIEDIQELFGQAQIKVIVGCAPCQPFSNHQKNKKSREEHKDWGLLYEFLRIVQGVEPEIVSMENVPAIKKEQVFKDFVKGLEDLGYYTTYKVENALNYGMAQRRNRLILLASKLGTIDFVDDREDKKTIYDIIGNLEEISAGEASIRDRFHISVNLSPINLERIKASKPGGTWEDWDEKLLPNCYRKKSGKTYTSVYGRMDYNSVAPTLTTQFYSYGTGRFGHPEQDRAISLREGALLQSFPLNYNFGKSNDEIVITAIARQIGNAVPPRLGLHIGRSIIEHLKGIEGERQ